jgi:hypothetical protein
MKLIRCKNCDDVVRLIHTRWRTCECRQSGGQYNGLTMSATIGGNCEVIGIRNDFFEHEPFSEERNIRNTIIQGEYEGDIQIYRIESPLGPSLKIRIEDYDSGVFKVIFEDDRNYSINLKGNKSPEFVYLPASNTPSFKADKINRI